MLVGRAMGATVVDDVEVGVGVTGNGVGTTGPSPAIELGHGECNIGDQAGLLADVDAVAVDG